MIQIRRLVTESITQNIPEDVAAIAAVFTQAVHQLAIEQYDLRQCLAWAPLIPDLNVWNQRLRAGITWVAESDGHIVGFQTLHPPGHLEFCFTAPEAARRGVASLLLQEVLAAARQLGATSLTTDASLVARPFFERHGFQCLSEEVVERQGVSFRRFAMLKPL